MAGFRQRGVAGTAVYTLGRFALVRAARKHWASVCAPVGGLCPASEPSVEHFDADAAVRGLCNESVFTGLKLRDGALSALLAAMARADGWQYHGDRERVTAEMRSRSGDGESPTVIVEYKSQELSDLVDRVARDPQLLAAVSNFLGRLPSHVRGHVQESPALEASPEYREANQQTVMFHYDVHGLDFVYVFFYLGDTRALNGAHELIRGSHKGKKLKHLLGNARRTDAEIYETYGRDRALVIEGPAGSGFIEDTSCFHRALAPKAKSRFALQIRYS